MTALSFKAFGPSNTLTIDKLHVRKLSERERESFKATYYLKAIICTSEIPNYESAPIFPFPYAMCQKIHQPTNKPLNARNIKPRKKHMHNIYSEVKEG